MGDKKILVLLTKQFPFFNKEQYVAHEIKYLAEGFERVLIYPHDYFGGDTAANLALPSNVEVIHLNGMQGHPISTGRKYLSFLRAVIFEIAHTHDKRWFLKNFRYMMGVYFTQYALGEKLISYINDNRIKQNEVVFYSYWFSASALCLAILKSRRRIASFYARAHSLDLYHEDWGLLNEKVRVLPFRNWKEKFVNHIFSITAHGRSYYGSKGINKVSTAYLGVENFGLNPPEPSSKLTVVTCSGIDHNKRIHLLATALAALPFPVKWIHFGDGPLKDLVHQALANSTVEFELRGHTANVDIREFYHHYHIDVFVNLSIVEGLPVTIMEALSAGIPVLATAVNGVPEAVIDHYNGRLLPVNFSNQDLVKLLKEFYQHDGVQTMREKARKTYEEKFDAEKNYARFAETLVSMSIVAH